MNVELLEQMLQTYNYDKDERNYLIQGFRHRFDIGYEGPLDRKDRSRN